LAASLAGLLRDPARLAAMKAQGKRSAVKWDWDSLARDMEDIYSEAVAARLASLNGRPVRAIRAAASPGKTSAK
jgi:hypothetical protein